MNLIAQAQSGTGKTATFALCMLQKINLSLKCPQVTTSFRVTVQCICLAPTRELARQIEEEIRILGQFTTATIQLVVRDKESMILFNSRVLVPSKIDSHIVVGTPGKLLDAVQRNHLNMSKISVFVLDEADMMISANMGEQSAKLRKFEPF